MKKTFLLIISVLLFGFAHAQNIDVERIHKDWSKLVDYVSLKYNQAGLEYGIKDEGARNVYKGLFNCLPIWVYIVLAVLLAAVVALAIWTFLLNRKMARNRHSPKRQDDSALFSRNSDAGNLQPQINILQDRVAYLEKEAALWDEKCSAIEKELSSMRNLSSQPTNVQPKVEEQSNTIYVKNFRDGELKKCSEEEAQFCLIETQQGILAFEFCGNTESAMANRDATFDGVCNRHGNPNNATKIVNENRGTVISVASDRWKVVEKATVKFE